QTHFKSILSISDIQKLLEPIAQKYFPGEGSMDLTALYEEIMKLELEQIDPLAKDVTRKFSMANDSFQNVSDEEKDFLHKFAFICMLSFDVYVKKQVIENLIDQMSREEKNE
ncbi:MAG TPA: hypothetical protein H9914_03625, partial [Candidatus Blautia avicola]|nr:hypothetical protein [Candidatus Blautia avicola]